MSGPRPVSRQRSRAAALQILYAMDLTSGFVAGEDGRLSADKTFEEATAYIEVPPGARDHARRLVLGVSMYLEELDGRIAAQARNWRMDRMATVDRNVLRLAAFEITYCGLPAPVVIDEAVELARRFGAERSPGFVNGVLDALARCWSEGRHE